MIFFGASSILKAEKLLESAKKHSFLLLNPEKIHCVEELLLAEKLSELSIKEKRQIAKTRENEFLLWLSAKKDISNAFKEYGFKSPENLLIISFSQTKSQLLKALEAKEKKLNLKKKATPLEIERISLSRIL
jgi:tRNA threonylcarbamoyladenosine modification (KEOPS) complex Cgi121 subunit